MFTPLQPIVPTTASGAVTDAVVLRPGATIDATVVKLLDANLVRIAIAGLTLDVASDVPLQAGQTLRFAVTPAADGLRLVIVPSADNALETAAASGAAAPARASDVSKTLTAAEMQAVAAAATRAAARQGGLSPLFANLTAAPLAALAPAVRAAAARVLAARLQGEGAVSGPALKSAMAGSGLFFEQHLASGTTSASGGPDMKAALLVLRHALAKMADAGISATPPAPARSVSRPQALLSPPLAPDGSEPAIAAAAGRAREPGPPAARGALTGAIAGLVRQAFGLSSARLPVPLAAVAQQTGVARTDLPAPPYRGAAPTAQPVAQPALAPDSSPAAAVHRLLADTDAVLMRQTLLQVASLPGPDTTVPRSEQTAARWLFELPIAVPQGTAVAQFEIFRDAAQPDDREAATGRRVWRARFSLDVEPAGPVHALVSLSGGTTSVRMWAERPRTAAWLRSETPELSRALREAALEPGDIMVGEGAPPSPPAPAGHFWDRAS